MRRSERKRIQACGVCFVGGVLIALAAVASCVGRAGILPLSLAIVGAVVIAGGVVTYRRAANAIGRGRGG